MKKLVSFKFSEAVIKALAELAKVKHQSKGSLIEELIIREHERVIGTEQDRG